MLKGKDTRDGLWARGACNLYIMLWLRLRDFCTYMLSARCYSSTHSFCCYCLQYKSHGMPHAATAAAPAGARCYWGSAFSSSCSLGVVGAGDGRGMGSAPAATEEGGDGDGVGSSDNLTNPSRSPRRCAPDGCCSCRRCDCRCRRRRRRAAVAIKARTRESSKPSNSNKASSSPPSAAAHERKRAAPSTLTHRKM